MRDDVFYTYIPPQKKKKMPKYFIMQQKNHIYVLKLNTVFWYCQKIRLLLNKGVHTFRTNWYTSHKKAEQVKYIRKK